MSSDDRQRDDRLDAEIARLYRRETAIDPSAPGHPSDADWERVICGDAAVEVRRAVLEHVVRCRDCAEIYRGLSAARREAAAFDPHVPRKTRMPVSSRKVAYGVAAAAVVAIALVPLVWRALRPQPGGTPPSVATPGLPLRENPVFRTEKAAVVLSASLALAPRGAADDRRRMLEALGEALAPYRRDDFPEAATRLQALGRAHPDAVEPALYAGISLLLAGRPSEAVPELERAQRLATDELRDETDWYVALAYVHSGETRKALAPLARACDHDNAYRDRACAAVRLIPSNP